jgi:hypothetical protein
VVHALQGEGALPCEDAARALRARRRGREEAVAARADHARERRPRVRAREAHEGGHPIAEKALHAYERDGAPSTPEQLGPTAIPVGEDPDGSRRYYGRFERPGNEQLDGKVVYEVLAEKFGPEAAAKACSMEASKDAIRDVLREHKPKDETLKAAEEAVLADVRARGGAKKPPTDKAAEFVIGPEGTMKKARLCRLELAAPRASNEDARPP